MEGPLPDGLCHGPAAPDWVFKTIVTVLAFEDLSTKRDQEYFAEGMSEEILNLLARVPGLRVAGRTSSFQFKGRQSDLREIGKLLGVQTILEGSVRKADERRGIDDHLGSPRSS